MGDWIHLTTADVAAAQAATADRKANEQGERIDALEDRVKRLLVMADQHDDDIDVLEERLDADLDNQVELSAQVLRMATCLKELTDIVEILAQRV